MISFSNLLVSCLEGCSSTCGMDVLFFDRFGFFGIELTNPTDAFFSFYWVSLRDKEALSDGKH